MENPESTKFINLDRMQHKRKTENCTMSSSNLISLIYLGRCNCHLYVHNNLLCSRSSMYLKIENIDVHGKHQYGLVPNGKLTLCDTISYDTIYHFTKSVIYAKIYQKQRENRVNFCLQHFWKLWTSCAEIFIVSQIWKFFKISKKMYTCRASLRAEFCDIWRRRL